MTNIFSHFFLLQYMQDSSGFHELPLTEPVIFDIFVYKIVNITPIEVCNIFHNMQGFILSKLISENITYDSKQCKEQFFNIETIAVLNKRQNLQVCVFSGKFNNSEVIVEIDFEAKKLKIWMSNPDLKTEFQEFLSNKVNAQLSA